MLRFAASTALRIASGTSCALPVPKPTCPLRSPTTTKAAKRKRRPPLTTLVTRLMATTFSSSSPSLFASIKAMLNFLLPLELQTSFTRSFSQSLHTTVVQVTTTVKYNNFDVSSLGAFCDQSSNLCCLFSLWSSLN